MERFLIYFDLLATLTLLWWIYTVRIQHDWRRNRDSNPSAQLRAYELSKPTPSTTWVFLRTL